MALISSPTVNQRGYTYFGVLFVIALIGLALSGAAMIWQVEQQREKERDLLFIGQQYIDAIAGYYHAAPGGNKKYPRNLADLLRDPRYPTFKRHLRKPWLDPLTLKNDWALIRTRQGGIAGVFSQAEGVPIKQAGFGELDWMLSGKTSYQDWQFIYIAAADKNQDKHTGDAEQTDMENADALDNQNEEEPDDGEEETGEELLPN